jgi:enoyl-CoA hydratase/carnithine racemase
MIFRAVEHAMGERRAVELSLTGREFGGEEARAYGLVTEIALEPLARAMDVAAGVAGFSPVAIGAGLDYVDQIRGRAWDHGGKLGREIRDRLLADADFREGTEAFLQKRQPSWPSLRE